MSFFSWLMGPFIYREDDPRLLQHDPFVIDASRVELNRNEDGFLKFEQSSNGALCTSFKYPYRGTIFEVKDEEQ